MIFTVPVKPSLRQKLGSVSYLPPYLLTDDLVFLHPGLFQSRVRGVKYDTTLALISQDSVNLHEPKNEFLFLPSSQITLLLVVQGLCSEGHPPFQKEIKVDTGLILHLEPMIWSIFLGPYIP